MFPNSWIIKIIGESLFIDQLQHAFPLLFYADYFIIQYNFVKQIPGGNYPYTDLRLCSSKQIQRS